MFYSSFGRVAAGGVVRRVTIPLSTSSATLLSRGRTSTGPSIGAFGGEDEREGPWRGLQPNSGIEFRLPRSPCSNKIEHMKSDEYVPREARLGNAAGQPIRRRSARPRINILDGGLDGFAVSGQPADALLP